MAKQVSKQLLAAGVNVDAAVAAYKAQRADMLANLPAEHAGKPLTDADRAKFKLPAAKVEKIARKEITAEVVAALTESVVAELVDFLTGSEA